MIDIRMPIGLLFSLLGLLLTFFGLFSDHAIYEKSLGINVNLLWGLVMLVFGAVMLFFARRTEKLAKQATEKENADTTRNNHS